MTQDLQPERTPVAEQALWNLADELRRSNHVVDLNALIGAAKKRGIPLSWEAISTLGPRLLRYEAGDVWLPPYVSKFLIAYLQKREISTALDPFAGVGGLIIPITSSCNVREATAVVRTQQSLAVAQAISEHLPIQWYLGNSEAVLSQDARFDLIISHPPWGLPSSASEFPSASGVIKLKD